jgi:glycosyltransferase involved in cell wall biosynthesis
MLQGAERPLKILIVLHMPWSRDMGGPRVSVEMADEWIRMGHTVDKFDLYDAFPRWNRLLPIFNMAFFPGRAIAHVRRHGHKYDVIQADQGNLPIGKGKMNYRGLLVARSNGLAHFYEEFNAKEARRKRRQGIREGSFAGNLLRALAARMAQVVRNTERSFDAADVIVLINEDERRYVAETLGHRDKAMLFHNGLSEERLAEFAAHRTVPAQRLAAQQIAFIGGWSDRKGAQDFPNLVRTVRAARPQTRFLLLGTGADQESLRARFEPQDREAVQVIASYRSAELPGLLAEASVGFLPSYIEGFGLGVLEALAAGIPTLAYDVPGPREMLRHFTPPLLTPPGDVEAAARRLVALLDLSEADYAALSARSVEVAGLFRWREIACRMLAHYQALINRRGNL